MPDDDGGAKLRILADLAPSPGKGFNVIIWKAALLSMIMYI